MNNRYHLFLITLFLLLCVHVTGVSAVSADDDFNKSDLQAHYQQAKFFYNQLKTTSTLGASRDNWLKGAGNFRRIYLAEPKSDLAPACLFMLGRIYYDMFKTFGKGIDLGESISYYRDVDTLFPKNNLADDALLAVGVILLEEVNDPKRAAKAFSKIISDHPDADMHSEAENRLKILSKDYNIPLPKTMLGSSQLMKLTSVLPVKYWSSKDYTRVVISTSGPITYREELLEEVGNQPRRLYIDFQDSYIEPRYRLPVPIEDGLLKRIRSGQFSPDTVRVVLDIESLSAYKIFSLPDPFRVVIDVRGQGKNEQTRTTASTISPTQPDNKPTLKPPADNKVRPKTDNPATADNSKGPFAVPTGTPRDGSGPEHTRKSIVVLKEKKKTHASEHTASSITASSKDQKELKFSLAQQLGLGVKKIVIDPGHGGKDPGAIAFGLKEKDIVLKVGLLLAERLRRNLHTEVVMTRQNDTFLPLEERTAIANTSDADLFVSLHINAHPSPRVNGFETYFLNLSTNEEAMRVAARENATTTHQMSDLQDILSDIMQNSKINESSRLAQQVHSSIGSGFGLKPSFSLKDMGIKQAPFYVLIGAEMPAILIELAFISNPDDAQKLSSQQFIDNLADNISLGIQQYIHATTAQL